jgi:hypothetical protein
MACKQKEEKEIIANPDFTIITTNLVSSQYDKNVEQIPFILSVPGVISLRNKNEPYKIFVGKKK